VRASVLARSAKADERFKKWLATQSPHQLHLYLLRLSTYFFPDYFDEFNAFGMMFVKRVWKRASCKELLEIHYYVGFMDGVTHRAMRTRRMKRRVRMLFAMVFEEMRRRVEEKIISTCK